MPRARRLATALASLALAGCGMPGAAPRGPLPERPRIVSMNPCIDAILARVADPAQVVAISHYSQEPNATSVDLKWASRFAVNYDTAEEVITFQPDLVLIGPHVAKATVAAIERSGVATETVGVPMTIAESLAQITQVAAAIGHPDRGAALVHEIETVLAAAAPRPGTPPIPALIWQGGGLVPGSGTLADELLVRTGFTNQSAAYGLAAWDILPVEHLIARPPAIIFHDVDHQARALRSGAVARLGKLTTLAPFPEHLLQCAGPNLIETTQVLAAAREEYLRSAKSVRFERSRETDASARSAFLDFARTERKVFGTFP
ncbi:ABC transporter substrate-binding protein [Sphingomonas japonica]|uniref:Iron complex transport system substrate-binding protein n=1 Tax=Sphingomonas japonica TaxID=511662 RepID=A0ABX0TW76_9SPHN|nr:ABC transporter substrate-binding protein [Sphingomonas japonica]NIJ22565.1 iron complex transport system substrate-binding protein [Sphingomonas japonica]